MEHNTQCSSRAQNTHTMRNCMKFNSIKSKNRAPCTPCTGSLFPRPLLLGAHQSKVLNNQTYFTRIEPLTVVHAVPCTMLKSCIAFSMVCGHFSCFLFILVRHTSSLYTYSSAWWILLSAILLPLRSSLHLIIIIIFFVYVQCVPGWKFFKWNGHFASEPKCTEGKHGILEYLQASGEYTFRASIVHLAFYVRKHIVIVFVCVCEWPFSKQNKYYLEWRKTRSRRQNGVSSLEHRCENNTPANRTNKKNANHHYAYSVCRWSTGSHSIHTSTPDAHWIDLFLFFVRLHSPGYWSAWNPTDTSQSIGCANESNKCQFTADSRAVRIKIELTASVEFIFLLFFILRCYKLLLLLPLWNRIEWWMWSLKRIRNHDTSSYTANLVKFGKYHVFFFIHVGLLSRIEKWQQQQQRRRREHNENGWNINDEEEEEEEAEMEKK